MNRPPLYLSSSRKSGISKSRKPARAPRPPRRRRSASAGSPFLPHLAWIVPLLVLDFFFFRWLATPSATPASPDAPSAAAPGAASPASAEPLPAPPPPPPPPVWASLHAPTPQTALDTPDAPGVLQPTGSGRLESAKFGSTRRAANGRPRFHEGVDIAATARDRRGRPTDPVFAVADGRVAHVNTVAGNSTYGKYVVVEHPDPTLGVRTNRSGTVVTSVVYTLYAHLADVRFGIRSGASVRAGEEIGTMGNTSATTPPIPWERAHLHWEVGLLLNSRYEARNRETKQKIPFGNYNGLNLFGLNPLEFWAARQRDPDLTFGAFLASRPPAAILVLRGRQPDFFDRNPGLWQGAPYDGSPIAVAISESGCPLWGRNANPSEISLLGNKRHAVAAADFGVLGNNARAYVTQRSGRWEITDAGKNWATHFFY